MPEAKFLRIQCPRCKKNHVVFGKSSTKVKCQKCNKLLVRTTGGKTKIKAKIQQLI